MKIEGNGKFIVPAAGDLAARGGGEGTAVPTDTLLNNGNGGSRTSVDPNSGVSRKVLVGMHAPEGNLTKSEANGTIAAHLSDSDQQEVVYVLEKLHEAANSWPSGGTHKEMLETHVSKINDFINFLNGKLPTNKQVKTCKDPAKKAAQWYLKTILAYPLIATITRLSALFSGADKETVLNFAADFALYEASI